MTPEQQSALEGLVGRALTAAELVALQPLVDARNDVAIAEVLSVGRKTLFFRSITTLGVRAALPIVAGSKFLKLLRELATATAVPDWLAGVLTSLGIPDDEHPAYLDTIASAHAGLQRDPGVDLGSDTARGMLDIIAASDPPALGAAVVTLKALAERDDPFHFDQVSVVLNKAERRMTL